VPQPVVAGWNPAKSADEVLAGIEQKFRSEPGFTSIGEYQSEQARKFGEEAATQ